MVGIPFEKGKSGNPSGRPKVVAELRELARQHGPETFEIVLKLRYSEDERIRIVACQEVLNRGYGKPIQGVEVTGEGGGPVIFQTIYESDKREGGGGK